MQVSFDIRIKNTAGKILFFDYVVDCEVVSSWQELTNTCTFTLPRKVSSLLNDNLDKVIQEGNEVVIKRGYGIDLVERFRGYIVEIGAGAPLEIKCEDVMWKLKQITVSETFKNAKLSDVLQRIMPKEIAYKVDDRNVGNVRYNKMTVAKILKDLRDTQNIYSYIRKGTLYAGFAYDLDMKANKDNEVFLHFEKNIFNNNLVYKRKEDTKVVIECISKHANGKDLKYWYPSKGGDGEVHTLHSYEKSLAAMQLDAKEMYDKMVYEGYRGSFTTFGHPYIDHGFVVHLQSDVYPEKKGKYLVDKLVERMGNIGIKQEVTLGPKA